MISVSNLSIQFGTKKLFDNVNLQFKPGNCYGVIGANGAGKSTFLKILSGEIDSTSGSINIPKNIRLSVLEQNQNKYDSEKVIDVVLKGHTKLYEIKKKMDELYSKPDFNDEDGNLVAKLSIEFEELDGWLAEANAATLLNGLLIDTPKHEMLMENLKSEEKVKVLLAKVLFGNPDIILLDEPTNNLDFRSIKWLENFLDNFENTVIVVSHDRHFLNRVCTHICDVDYGKIKIYPGNYDFWYESSKLAKKMIQDENKKKEDQVKELKEFIARFSANASKSKQATSRKKILEKITIEDIGISSRRYPYINFDKTRDVGNDILQVNNLTKVVDGKKVLDDVSFTILKNEKVAFVSQDDIALSTLFDILANEQTPDSGSFEYGVTITTSYMPKNNEKYFQRKISLVDWLRDFSPEDQTDPFIRSFLGRMLFSGEDALKNANVLSGGEKMRCMFAKMMLKKANLIILDDPTNHLDLETITALNESLIRYSSNIIFTSKDQEIIETVATKIIELENGKIKEYNMSYQEYINLKE